MSIEKLKSLLGDDDELNELTDDAVKRGFLDLNGIPTDKNNNSNLESYANFMVNTEGVEMMVISKSEIK